MADKVTMKRSWCLGAGLMAVATAGCSMAPAGAMLPSAVRPFYRPLRIQVAEDRNIVRRVSLEQYVQATIISEFAPASGEPDLVGRMLEVQAVIGRTYAIANVGRHARQGFDLCSTTHCQLYEPSRLRTSRWAPAAKAAAARTAGAVLWHDHRPVIALFHADCGGHTNTAMNAWRGTPRAYLSAVP
ncbi:MAG: SpoIID/LytB domain-containing protein, partial [Acidobacteria bacterium]|nr:SpoIID/LytB domain-containing protein [Acidobacteriota bacterium]